MDVPWTRRAGGGEGSSGRAGTAAKHGGDARHQGFVDLLRADEMDVAVDAAGGNDHPFTGNRFGARANNDVDPRLDVRIAGLADSRDATVLEADVGLDDAGHGVDDQGVGDDSIDNFGRHALTLPHTVADDLAAAEFNFLAIDREVLFDLYEEFGIGQTK